MIEMPTECESNNSLAQIAMHEGVNSRSLQSYGYVLRGATGTLALRIIAAGLTLILSWMLARALGVTDYGTYVYALTWVHFLATPACLGTDRLLVRLMAAYRLDNRWGLARGLLRWSSQSALAASLALASIAFVICLFFSPSLNQAARQTFIISLLALPFFVLTNLKQSALQGMQQVLRGQLSEAVFRPLFTLGLFVIIYFMSGKHPGTPAVAVVTVIASGVSFLIAAKLLSDSLPQQFKATSSEYQTSDWTSHALPLLLVATLGIISTQTETLILGALKGMEAVSYFTVANRGAELISLALLILGVPLAPTYARLWAGGELEELGRVARLGAYASLMLALPIAFALIFYGRWLLSLFGHEFTQAHLTLSVLSVGQIINVMMGSVGLLLIMSGLEREVAAGTAVSIIIKLILCALFIPRWGPSGAAVARSGSLLAWNLILLHSVYKKLAINPTVFGKLNLTGRDGG